MQPRSRSGIFAVPRRQSYFTAHQARQSTWSPRSGAIEVIAGLGVLALAGTLGAARVHAMPTGAPLWGITGTGTLPTTEVVPVGETEVGLMYENIDPAVGGKVRFFPIGTACYGLKRGEIGGGLLREKVDDVFLNTSFTTTYSTLHGKYRLFEKPESGTAIAVGTHFLDFGRVPGNVLSLYAVASKELTRGASSLTSTSDASAASTGPRVRVTGNLGVLYQRINGVNEDNNVRPFVSLQARRGAFSLNADYTPRSGQSVKIYSLAARYEKDRLGLQIGYGQFRGSDEKYFAGASYRFGGR
jgi:hypothetical protein